MQVLKIKGLLAEKGITQKNLAATLGLSPNTLSRKLKRGGSFTTDEATSICDALDISDDRERGFIFLR